MTAPAAFTYNPSFRGLGSENPEPTTGRDASSSADMARTAAFVPVVGSGFSAPRSPGMTGTAGRGEGSLP